MACHCGQNQNEVHLIRKSSFLPGIFLITCYEQFHLLNTISEDYLMQTNEFRRPVSADSVSPGSRCEWCGKAAEQQLTAIGGSHHNESGMFCRPCGEKFTEAVINAINIAAA